MLKFNNNNIFTGYIKQLLASFYLPRYKIYTKNTPIISTIPVSAGTAHPRYFPYIKDGTIQYYIDGRWICHPECIKDKVPHEKAYEYNRLDLNNVKTLKITNTIYDSYTHEYLGDFLRFQRDYWGLDLMPLYNCFSNRLCNNLATTITIETSPKIKQAIFNTKNPAYKIYMIPVKLFQQYTIAIECSSKIELYCGLYGKYQPSEDATVGSPYAAFHTATYQSIAGSRFNSPFLYTKLANITDNLDVETIANMELPQKEKDLKLFIKVPANTTTSITILEGNYLNWGDRLLKKGYPIYVNSSDYPDTLIPTRSYTYKFGKTINHYVTNYAPIDKSGNTEDLSKVYELFKPITPLQLLKLNTGESYPFADRLIEYLIGNAITTEDTLEDNIKRVQEVVQLNGHSYTYYGVWEQRLRPLLYDYMQDTANKTLTEDINHDILGYVDKDVEKYYSYSKYTQDPTTKKVKANSISISGIDIYAEED